MECHWNSLLYERTSHSRCTSCSGNGLGILFNDCAGSAGSPDCALADSASRGLRLGVLARVVPHCRAFQEGGHGQRLTCPYPDIKMCSRCSHTDI